MYKNDIFSIKGKKESLESLPAVNAKEKTKEQENNCTASSEEDDNYYMLWQFLDSSEILDHFDFFKNAGNVFSSYCMVFINFDGWFCRRLWGAFVPFVTKFSVVESFLLVYILWEQLDRVNFCMFNTCN